MREFLSRFWFIFVIIGFVALILFDRYSYDERSERKLSQFADPKEAYGMLLSGKVAYQGDTVIFDLIPGVAFPIEFSEHDQVTIKSSSGETVEFFRHMVNMWNIPDPCGNGKAMERWQADTKDQKKEKRLFEIFEKVVKNGKISYSGFQTETSLRRNFEKTYGKPPQEAERLAKKVMNPMFSPRKMGKGSTNLVVKN